MTPAVLEARRAAVEQWKAQRAAATITQEAPELASGYVDTRQRRAGRPCDVRPFPFEPLERKIRAALGVRACTVRVAKDLGCDPRQLYRWRKTGLRVDQADELAVRVGYHPGEVWPEWASMDG